MGHCVYDQREQVSLPPQLGLSYTDESSIQFNIVCKHLGAERMSFYLNEAAGDIRDMLLPGLEAPKAKL